MQLTVVSVTIAVLIAIACAWYCRRLAREKRRSAPLWTLLGLVLTIIAVPVLVLLPEVPEPAARSGTDRDPARSDATE